jgi:hypothetical protein
MSYMPISGKKSVMNLEIVPVADSASGMGRPPLGLKPTTVRLPLETIRRIEALEGKQRRLATFIREAIENELERRESQDR